MLVGINLLIVVICHNYKDVFLGFDFYYIPSVSMAPTLLPGDLVVVDTRPWQAKHKAHDILVFKKSKRSFYLIKRLKKIEYIHGKKQHYLVGDNSDRSIDSRQFGWVAEDFVIGKASFVLVSFSNISRAFQWLD